LIFDNYTNTPAAVTNILRLKKPSTTLSRPDYFEKHVFGELDNLTTKIITHSGLFNFVSDFSRLQYE
jgi:hypothetical protein